MKKKVKYDLRKVFIWLNARSVWWLSIYAVIWLALGLFATFIVQKQIVESLGENTGNLIAATMTHDYTETDFVEGFHPQLRERLNTAYSDRDLKANYVRKILIFNLQGKILYTTDPALEGEVEAKDLDRLHDNRITSEKEGEALSIIVPIKIGQQGKLVGAFEIYTDFSKWTDKLQGMRFVALSFIFISALLMLAALSVLIRRATDTIESTNESMANLSKRLEESRAFLSQSNSGTISALLTALDAKDRYTARHSSNVATYALKIGAELNLSELELHTLETAAILHDIGKIGIPEHILNKRSPLDTGEFELVKKHSEVGAQIIHFIYYLEEVAEVILYHHERYDGKGYPKGLAGAAIPLTARILAVADVYDALTTDRPYRRAMPRVKARSALLDGSGSQFDSVVVSAFVKVLDKETQLNTTG